MMILRRRERRHYKLPADDLDLNLMSMLLLLIRSSTLNVVRFIEHLRS